MISVSTYWESNNDNRWLRHEPCPQCSWFSGSDRMSIWKKQRVSLFQFGLPVWLTFCAQLSGFDDRSGRGVLTVQWCVEETGSLRGLMDNLLLLLGGGKKKSDHVAESLSQRDKKVFLCFSLRSCLLLWQHQLPGRLTNR